MDQPKNIEANELGAILLDVGINLLGAGASCNRIRITMRRLAAVYDYTPHISIAPKSVSLTLDQQDDHAVFSGIRSIPIQGVNFKIISGISRLSWDAVEGKFSIKQTRDELNRLLALPHYPRLVVLLFVSLAGAGFCFTFGGNLPEMLIAFGATFCGLFVRQQAAK